MSTISQEYADSCKPEKRSEATWYALGYFAGRNTSITADAAKRFGDSYADLYAEWLTSGDVNSYPLIPREMAKWLAL